MLRRDLALQKRMAEDSQFVHKLGALPVVSSAVTTAVSVYQKTKQSNCVMNYTLNVAENSVKSVAGSAQPLLSKYNEPLKKVNDFACDKLESITASYPIISKPPTEILEESKEACSNLIKPAVDTVSSIKEMGVGAYNMGVATVSSAKQYGVDTVTSVTNYGKESVDCVKGYGKDKLTEATTYGTQQLAKVTSYGQEKLSEALSTATGQKVASQLVTVLDLSDSYIDKYLPALDEDIKDDDSDEIIDDADDDDDESSDDDNNESDDNKDDVTEPIDDATPDVQLQEKAIALKTKLQRRIVKRALNNLVTVKVRSKEVLDQISSSLNLLEKLRDNASGVKEFQDQISDKVSNAKTKIGEVWTEITTEPHPGLVEQDTQNKSLEERSIIMARNLVSALRSNVESLQSTVTHLPDIAREKYEDMQTLTENLATTFNNVTHASEISSWMITNARESVDKFRMTLTSMIDTTLSFASFDWLIQKSRISELTDKSDNEPIEMMRIR